MEQRTGRRGGAIAALIALLLTVTSLSSAIGIIVMMLASHGTAQPGDLSQNPWPGLPAMALAEAALAILVYRLLARRAFPGPADPPKGGLKELLLGMAIGGGAVAFGTLVLALLGVYRPLGPGSWQGVLVGLAAGLGAGVAEELLFRGVLLRLFFEKWGAAWAILVNSLLFGLIHFGNDLQIAEVLGVFLAAGLLLNAVWFFTKSVWISIGAHFAWNFALGGVFGMPISGIAVEGGGLLRSALVGTEMLTGGVSGPEASLPFVAATSLVGLLVLGLAIRQGKLRNKPLFAKKKRPICLGAFFDRPRGGGRREAVLFGLPIRLRPRALRPFPCGAACS
ncbi:MAG: CPBP family intramembrane metalloprotease [Christensenellaceae bacterium]|jgi:membrane protease YdiL (CAAX protease family)|nr:CPBP family intramembrane metalloprotease [Christensenellaceae bacterium]